MKSVDRKKFTKKEIEGWVKITRYLTINHCPSFIGPCPLVVNQGDANACDCINDPQVCPLYRKLPKAVKEAM